MIFEKKIDVNCPIDEVKQTDNSKKLRKIGTQ